MTSATASINRVAWAWLDRLIGKSPQEDASAPAMPPQERKRLLENAYEDLKGALTKAIGAEILPLSHAEVAIAQRHGIDPLFLSWFILNTKHWPSMSTRTRRALQAVRSIHMWFGAMPDHWKNMRVPEIDEAADRDNALREVGDWFVKTAMPRIERQYINAVWKKARELAGAFGGRGSRPDPKASLLLMQDFEKRLVGDRFQLKPAVQKVVDLFE